MNIIYRLISLAESGKRDTVFRGATYSASSELFQHDAARLYQVWAYRDVCPREREGASREPTHLCRTSSSLTKNIEHDASATSFCNHKCARRCYSFLVALKI
jgi:hypothetical protein